MGTPVPPDYLDYEDTKWYRAFVDGFLGGGPADCTQDFFLSAECCTDGVSIKAWLAMGFECLSPNELCFIAGPTAQRLKAAHGPYDTYQDCIDAWH